MHNILMLSISIGGVLIYMISSRQKVQKHLTIWGGMNLFVFGALRSVLVGIDTSNYADTYLKLPYMSFADIFNSNAVESRDPFFYSFLKVLSFVNKDPQLMLIVISGIVAVCFSIFIYRNSLNPILSYLIFIGLRYFSFTLSGLRQALALAIIMISYEYIKDKKFPKFFALVFLASLFHLSAIVFIIAYPLANIKKTEKLYPLIIVGLFLSFTLDQIIFPFISTLPLMEQYQNYLTKVDIAHTGMTMLVIYLITILAAFYFRNQKKIKSREFNIMNNLSIIGVAFTILSFKYANFFRIGYYFIISIVLLLPSIINSISDKTVRIISFFTIAIILIVQLFIIGPGAGVGIYRFFWK